MMELAFKGRNVEISLNGTYADLRISSRQEGICIREHGREKEEVCFPISSTESIHIVSKSSDSLVELNCDFRSGSLPPIDFGRINGRLLVFGATQNIRATPEVKDLLLVEGNTPEELARNEQRINSFHYKHRPDKTLLEKLKAKICVLFGRDAKLGVSTWSEVVDLANDFIGGRSTQTVIARFLVRRRHSDINEKMLKEMKEILKPGDILLRFQKGYPIDRLLVGVWQHAGACIDNNGNIIDSEAAGVNKKSIEQFSKADGIAILRPNFSPAQRQEFLSYLRLQQGKSYNYNFDSSSAEQYCSGLVMHALMHCDFVKNSSSTIRPDELLKVKNIKVIWSNRKDLVEEALQAE